MQTGSKAFAPMLDEEYSYEVTAEEAGQRIDQVLAAYPELASRTAAQRLLKSGMALLNGKEASPAQKVRLGDHLSFSLPEPELGQALPEAGPLEILYEDPALIVINKEPGVVVHPAPGHASGTLVNYVLHHCRDLAGIGGVLRPGIVHRLDKDTSGVLVIAKTDEAHQGLAAQFKTHSIQRKYVALVWGKVMLSGGTIEAPLGRHPVHRKQIAIVSQGKEAITHWKVLERFDQLTLVECRLETGRTHQIRVHLTSKNMPLVGDPQYGSPRRLALKALPAELLLLLKNFRRQALHAQELGFFHPLTQELLQFRAPIPPDFASLLKALRQCSE